LKRLDRFRRENTSLMRGVNQSVLRE